MKPRHGDNLIICKASWQEDIGGCYGFICPQHCSGSLIHPGKVQQILESFRCRMSQCQLTPNFEVQGNLMTSEPRLSKMERRQRGSWSQLHAPHTTCLILGRLLPVN